MTILARNQPSVSITEPLFMRLLQGKDQAEIAHDFRIELEDEHTILIPFNRHSIHWTLICVLIKNGGITITHYDGLQKSNPLTFKEKFAILRWINPDNELNIEYDSFLTSRYSKFTSIFISWDTCWMKFVCLEMNESVTINGLWTWAVFKDWETERTAPAPICIYRGWRIIFFVTCCFLKKKADADLLECIAQAGN